MLLVCPGLDHAHRGFETFARECFDALRGRTELRLELVKGSGVAAPGEATVPTLRRDSALARRIARVGSVQPFIVEHAAFGLALLPVLLARRPRVVYFSEWHVGLLLAHWRQMSRQPVRLVFCNGALAPGGYGHLDLVQQLAPGAIEFTAARGEPVERQRLLPLGARIATGLEVRRPADRDALRRRLGLPGGRRIVLSAGALNRHKRVDYVIEEIASLPEPRPFLLVLGQREAETPALERLAAARLGSAGHAMRTVRPDEMDDYYRASDVFVLASLWESFGRVLVEAAAHGLPCLAHEHPVMSWVLGEAGHTADLSRPGALASWLMQLGTDEFSLRARRRRHRDAYTRFSWDRLADSYVELLLDAAALPRGARSG